MGGLPLMAAPHMRNLYHKVIGLSPHAFYARVRQDPLIGPVFTERITDWDQHLQRMCLFWSSVALMSGRYHGEPMRKHAPLPIDRQHFDRWLDLFRQTARAVCPPRAAELFIERAGLIARNLELGIASARHDRSR